MMKNYFILSALVSVMGFSYVTDAVYADDAAVLPQGRWRVRLVTAYTESSNKLDSNGDPQPFGAAFSKKLDAKFLNLLSPEAAKGFKAMAAQMGLGENAALATLETEVDSFVVTNAFCAEYGLSDRLSVGAVLPVMYGNVKVRADSQSDAAFDQALNAMNKQMAQLPENHPGKKSLQQLMALRAQVTTAGLNQVLKQKYQYSDGLQSWSSMGLGDLELGGKYNYFRSEVLLSTLKAGVRLPTGRENDPNALFDMGFGDGQVDIGAYNYIDYHFLRNAYLTLETGYTAQLPNTSGYRIPLSEDITITDKFANVTRKLGDYWDVGLEANYSPFRAWTASSRYHFRQKFQDHYSGAGDFNSMLEADTSQILHEGQFQLEYTNLYEVRAGRASFPYAVAAFYQQPLGGKNVVDTRTTGLQLKAYF